MSSASSRWIMVVARNNLHLLQQAVRSFELQQGGANVLVVNNGSTDGTASWLHGQPHITSLHYTPQRGVAHAWNQALKYLFTLGGSRRVDRVLVCNQDVMLRPETYSLLEAEQADFVTAVGTSDKSKITAPHVPAAAPRPHPDFSCYMISRECYERVGPFDEGFAPAWFEDNKYHIEMWRHGIRAYAIDLPFWHVGGGAQTLRNADATEYEALTSAFARNRKRFVEEYGCDPADTKEYEKLFSDESFGIYQRT